MFLALASTKTI